MYCLTNLINFLCKLSHSGRISPLLLAVACCMPVAAEPFLEKQPLFTEGSDGFTLYRIPGIVVTVKGTVLAYCEARKFTVADRGEIEIHMRRSTDGGRTWEQARQVAHMGPRLPRNPHMPMDKQGKNMGGPDEQTVNNAVAIAARDGLVHLVYCVEYCRAFHIFSEDDGVSWSAPVEITHALEKFRDRLDWQAIASGPGHAIQMDNGRLLVPFWMATYEQEAPLRKAVGIIYSDDNGSTWQTGDIAVPQGGEPNIAQLADGRVIVTSRNTLPQDRRLACWSRDGASGWSIPMLVEDLPEPGCMAGIVACDMAASNHGRFLLYSSPDTTKREHKERVNVTIRASFDGGLTWPVKRLLEDGPSAYSDLAVLQDGTILCFYESGGENPPRIYKRKWAYSYLNLARFNIDWLMPVPEDFKDHNEQN